MLIEFSLHSLLKPSCLGETQRTMKIPPLTKGWWGDFRSKIELLKAHGVDVSKEIIEDIVRNPDKIDIGYKERLIAQKGSDETHVLRVVYEEFPDKKYVVTVYPGRRSRYETD